jgi:hypothetical protein
MIYCIQWASARSAKLFVEGLGEGGSGSDVSIAGSLVGAGGLLEGLSISKVSGAVLLVGSSVVGVDVDVKHAGEKGVHLEKLRVKPLVPMKADSCFSTTT